MIISDLLMTICSVVNHTGLYQLSLIVVFFERYYGGSLRPLKARSIVSEETVQNLQAELTKWTLVCGAM